MSPVHRQHRFHRALFISDVHLGFRHAKAKELLNFLDANDAPIIYLVGDFYDIKRLRRSVHWPQSHGAVVRKIREKARAGSRIVYLPGNHDKALRRRQGLKRLIGNIEIVNRTVHETANGQRFLVVHGDQHEPPRAELPATFIVGCALYLAGVQASQTVSHARRRLGYGFWSLSAAVKDRVLPHVGIARRYRENLADDAGRCGLDGVIAGHIHHAGMEEIGGVLYCNTGDWVESCTALVENLDGELELLRWRGADRHYRVEHAPNREEPVPTLSTAA